MRGFARSGDLDIAYDVRGGDDDPALLLIPGLGSQLLFFEDEFVDGLVDRAFRPIRIDNRDVGLSSTYTESEFDLTGFMAVLAQGRHVEAPYTLADMADDAIAVFDHLGVHRGHVLGVSLGGMVAQSVALRYPGRVQSLTLVSTTTGSPEVGQPSAEALTALMDQGPREGREAIIEHDTRARKIWATAEHYDEAWTRDYFAAAYDRAHNPWGSSRHMAAVLATPDREPALADLTVPTLVVHGSDDVLIAPSGGERLAELIANAELVELEGMGHDLPPHYWAPLIEAITQLAIRSA